jgi:hypothetical protein
VLTVERSLRVFQGNSKCALADSLTSGKIFFRVGRHDLGTPFPSLVKQTPVVGFCPHDKKLICIVFFIAQYFFFPITVTSRHWLNLNCGLAEHTVKVKVSSFIYLLF